MEMRSNAEGRQEGRTSVTSEGDVLLAEDSDTDAELTIRALRRGGLAGTIVRARDGAEALDYLFRRGVFADRPEDLPRLVLLDLHMPRMDGLEALRQIRSSPALRSVPVVMLTSSNAQEDIAASYGLGTNSYLVKPVDFTRFVADVAEAGRYWMALNQTRGPVAAPGS